MLCLYYSLPLQLFLYLYASPTTLGEAFFAMAYGEGVQMIPIEDLSFGGAELVCRLQIKGHGKTLICFNKI